MSFTDLVRKQYFPLVANEALAKRENLPLRDKAALKEALKDKETFLNEKLTEMKAFFAKSINQENAQNLIKATDELVDGDKNVVELRFPYSHSVLSFGVFRDDARAHSTLLDDRIKAYNESQDAFLKESIFIGETRRNRVQALEDFITGLKEIDEAIDSYPTNMPLSEIAKEVQKKLDEKKQDYNTAMLEIDAQMKSFLGEHKDIYKVPLFVMVTGENNNEYFRWKDSLRGQQDTFVSYMETLSKAGIKARANGFAPRVKDSDAIAMHVDEMRTDKSVDSKFCLSQINEDTFSYLEKLIKDIVRYEGVPR